ncbi:hypothetical protein BDL97_08G079500 [Sphagnum fallax]|nr:hypothetical protein BDL97_08G079500 [Sphagnum fallax]KAH8954469.1 hypothetical protein BDL97_08G079500 [Sphagnum fallax]
MKLVVNMIMGRMMASFSEGLVLGKKVGLDPATIVEVLGQGAIAAPMFAMKGQSMLKGSYPPAFPLKHQQKVRNSSPSPHKAETVVTEGEDSTDGLFPCEEFSGCCGLGPCFANFSITDLRLALAMAEDVAQPTPVAASVNDIYKRAKAEGLGDQDFSAIIGAYLLDPKGLNH